MAPTTLASRTTPPWLALGASVVAGAMIGAQGRINGEAAAKISPLEAAAASFVVGLVMLAVVIPTRRNAVIRLRQASTRWWWWLGGLGGAFLVSTSAHGVPEIGVALVSVCLVAGTTTGGLITDQFGLGPGGKHPAALWRFVGAGVVIGAVAIGAAGEHGASLKPLLFVLLFLAGASSAVQQAANGQLRGASDDVVVASFVSFLVGSLALVVVVIAAGELDLAALPSAPWLYLGGPLGVFYILTGAATVKALGVLRFVLGVVSGQLLAAVVIDAAWPAPHTTLKATTVIGAVVTLFGVWLSGRDRE